MSTKEIAVANFFNLKNVKQSTNYYHQIITFSMERIQTQIYYLRRQCPKDLTANLDIRFLERYNRSAITQI
jgi:hypothetical protein